MSSKSQDEETGSVGIRAAHVRLFPGMIVDSLDGQGRPTHVPCLAFDGFPVGAIDGLS